MLKKGEDEIEGKWTGGGGKNAKYYSKTLNFKFPEIKIANRTTKYLIKPFVALQLPCYQSNTINLIAKTFDLN